MEGTLSKKDKDKKTKSKKAVSALQLSNLKGQFLLATEYDFYDHRFIRCTHSDHLYENSSSALIFNGVGV